MNTAAVSVISASRLVTPGANRIRNTSAFFRKLSLNAEKNWHQNSGAKRRDVIRWSDIGDSPRAARMVAGPITVVAGLAQAVRPEAAERLSGIHLSSHARGDPGSRRFVGWPG